MKKFTKKGLFMAVAAIAVVIGGVMFGNVGKAEAAVKCYTIGTSNVQVYSNTGLSRKWGTIYPSDQITVNTVTDRYCKVTYPIARGTKTGYIQTGKILTKTIGNTYTCRAQITTYRRPGGSSYGYISKGDSVKVLGTSGNYTQVKYPVSGGYKYAFISTGNCNTYIKAQNNISTGNSIPSQNIKNTNTGNTANAIVRYELSQVGVGDYRGNNNVKYNTWYYRREVKGNGYAWCMVFQAYAADQFGKLGTAVPRTASCTEAVNWYKRRGQFHLSRYYGGNYTPKAGDLVFYTSNGGRNSCHVGMITGAPVNGYLQTVEGNIVCSDGNWKVVTFTRNAKRTVGNAYVYGYASPNY